jgi:hypothetical protein
MLTRSSSLNGKLKPGPVVIYASSADVKAFEDDTLQAAALRIAFRRHGLNPTRRLVTALPTGSVLGVATITSCHYCSLTDGCFTPPGAPSDGSFDEEERFLCTPWSPIGSWHVVLRSPLPLPEPMVAVLEHGSTVQWMETDRADSPAWMADVDRLLDSVREERLLRWIGTS